MNDLLKISAKLIKAANLWPLSEDRRLDVLRLAKRIRNDAMDNQNLELLLISAAANGCRYVEDFSEESGLSKKETVEILHHLWQMGRFVKGEESLHGRGRPRVVFMLPDEFLSKAQNADSDDLDLLT